MGKNHPNVDPYVVSRVRALESLLLEKGIPWPVLGLPPTWYKMPAYRSRAVIEPRKVLAEFGVDVPPEREVRVWDSSAEMRYMVLPRRPPGTEQLGEAELVPLVTRDALI